MTKRTYDVAGNRFSVVLEDPWSFMTYASSVLERIHHAAEGLPVPIMPVRAGDPVPPRSYVTTKSEFPDGYNRYMLDFSQYEPFLVDDASAAVCCTGAPQEMEKVAPAQRVEASLEAESDVLFTVTVREGVPEGLLEGAELIYKETSEPPYQYIWHRGDCDLFELFQEGGDKPTAYLQINSDRKDVTIWPADGRLGYRALSDISTGIMIAYASATMRRSTLLMHASCVRMTAGVHEGEAVLFFGTSGTGKSTHARLWLKNVPDTELLNDDNPVLRIIEVAGKRQLCVFGSPWSGKTPCYRRVTAPVRGLIRLEQAKENVISHISGLDEYASIVSSASCLRWHDDDMEQLTRTAEEIAMTVPAFLLECLPDADAALKCSDAVLK